MLPNEPLALTAAAKLAKDIVFNGITSLSGHCQDRMKKRGMTAVDCVNVARGGWCESYDYEGGSFRYTITTHRMAVVVAFEDVDELVFVTCWRVQ